MTLVASCCINSDPKDPKILWTRTGKINPADAYVWAALGRQNRLWFAMETILTPDEIFQLITTGMVNLTDDLVIRLTESSRDAHHNLDESAHIHLD